MSDPPAGLSDWRDARVPLEARVDSLLAIMTLEVKVAKLGAAGFSTMCGRPPIPIAQVVRPVGQLVVFARVGLGPGEVVDLSFRLHADRSSYPGPDLRRIVEAGDIDLLVGTSAADLRFAPPFASPARPTSATATVSWKRRSTSCRSLTSTLDNFGPTGPGQLFTVLLRLRPGRHQRLHHDHCPDE